MSARRHDLLTRLRAAGDPERAVGQQRYMKSSLPFHGVRVPEVRRIAREVALAHPFVDRDDWTDGVLEIWREATRREEQYGATELALDRTCRPWLDGGAIPMIEEMIVTGAWWDHVDALAAHHMGTMLRQDPGRVRPLMWKWATDDLARDGSLWRRRTAILCQLRAREATDVALLHHAIESSMDEPEFFLRKAIGWALRQHAYVDVEGVAAYVDEHHERLSGLSRREALRHVDKLRGTGHS